VTHTVWPAARNELVACILFALFIGSVVYEVISVDPRRRILALVVGFGTGALVLLLLVLLMR
jgi:F0F1-type ATP synthase assembly protein I